MAKQLGSTLIIEAIKANPGATIAQLAAATGMTTNGASSTISNINRIAKNTGLRIVGSKIPGSASYSYVIEYLATPGDAPTEAPKNKANEIKAAVAMLAPSIEQSTEQLAQYIAGQMRAEFDARLAIVLRPAIETGIIAMMSGIRSAMADAFRLPEVLTVEPAKPNAITAKPADRAGQEQQAKTEKLSQLMGEAVAPLVQPVSLPAPVVNVISTRTRHREKTKPDAAETISPAVVASGKRKIIICSLLPAQKEIISREFADCFDLRMYHKDQEKSLRKAINHGDTVMLMGDFLGHSVFKMCEAQGAEVITVKGGLTHLRDALTGLYVGAEKVAA